ncbi:hypothetical protein VKT23_004634 [Stygiomarasmius scandens]|uniref:Uncharacterized protein n=1 Tax=Marasmiellus scandens TaxID=2682957 RepID=A0ABR1JUS9_9AGAR
MSRKKCDRGFPCERCRLYKLTSSCIYQSEVPWGDTCDLTSPNVDLLDIIQQLTEQKQELWKHCFQFGDELRIIRRKLNQDALNEFSFDPGSASPSPSISSASSDSSGTPGLAQLDGGGPTGPTDSAASDVSIDVELLTINPKPSTITAQTSTYTSLWNN